MKIRTITLAALIMNCMALVSCGEENTSVALTPAAEGNYQEITHQQFIDLLLANRSYTNEQIYNAFPDKTYLDIELSPSDYKTTMTYDEENGDFVLTRSEGLLKIRVEYTSKTSNTYSSSYKSYDYKILSATYEGEKADEEDQHLQSMILRNAPSLLPINYVAEYAYEETNTFVWTDFRGSAYPSTSTVEEDGEGIFTIENSEGYKVIVNKQYLKEIASNDAQVNYKYYKDENGNLKMSGTQTYEDGEVINLDYRANKDGMMKKYYQRPVGETNHIKFFTYTF